jgi:hypothetical protein
MNAYHIQIALLCSAFLLTGCATPITRTVVVDNIPIIEHIDYQDNPCFSRGVNAGCHQIVLGTHNVWYSSVADPHVWHHEVRGHVFGMSHGEWRYDKLRNVVCTTVIVGNKDYPQGATVCNNGKTEIVFMEKE